MAGLLYAYDRGGVDEAGIVAVVLLAPALFVAPIASFAADRFHSGRVLAAGYAIQSASMLLAALAIASDLPPVPTYGAMLVAASGITLTRPAIGAALPYATRTPADLTAANVVIGFVEYSGMFLGPAITGLLVAGFDHAAPFALCGVLTAGSAVLALGIRSARHDEMPADADERPVGPIRETLDGLRVLSSHRSARVLIGILSVGSLVIGAADVLFVATADHLSEGDTSRAGLFGTALGLGALGGAGLTVLLVGRRRLTPSIVLAVAAMGLSLGFLAIVSSTVSALLLFAVIGGGESVMRVSTSTLIQRVAPSDVVGRFFGVAEGLHMFSLAIGSGVISLLISRLGFEDGLLVAGIAIPTIMVLRSSTLFRVDRAATVPDDRVLEVILGDEIFDGLPAPTVERLAADAVRVQAEPGTTIIAEGAHGDRYYVIDRGTADVSIDGAYVRTIGEGGGFGELALLRDVPRTATVVATSVLDLVAFERELFLQAITGQPRSLAVGAERSAFYLGEPDLP